MANQLYAGFLYDDSGAAVNGADVYLYDRNTTTPVRAQTTTNASGYWAISHATEGRFDVEIVNGTSKRRIKYDDSVQLETIEVAVLRMRTPLEAFDYEIVPAEIAADRQLNLPLITATDTLSALGLAQTYSAVKTFSAIPVMSGGAVGFPATQVASAGANDLDDYEEGTWTPTIIGSSTAGSQSYSTQAGQYVKIGSLVMISCRVTLSAKGGTMAGNVLIGGIPFTALTLADVSYHGSIGAIESADLSAGYSQFALVLASNGTTIALNQIGDNVATAAVGVAAIIDTTGILMTLCYRTA